MSLSLGNMAANVKRLREELQLSQPQLAKKAGVHLNTITRIEKQYGSPSWETAQRLAEALSTSIEALSKKPDEAPTKKQA